MSTSFRALPGAAALLTAILAGYAWTLSGEPSFYVIGHIASTLLCLAVPMVFILTGRALRCRFHLLKVGAVLLLIAGVPLIVMNVIYLFEASTPASNAANMAGDFGGLAIASLSWVALVITSLACAIGLPLSTQPAQDQHRPGTSSPA